MISHYILFTGCTIDTARSGIFSSNRQNRRQFRVFRSRDQQTAKSPYENGHEQHWRPNENDRFPVGNKK